MDFLIKDKVYMTGLNKQATLKVIESLTLPNCQKFHLQKMGRYSQHLPDTLNYYKEIATLAGRRTLIVPRGAAMVAYRIAREYHDKNINITDERLSFSSSQVEFTGKLKPFQEEAVSGMLPYSSGILVFPTGGGKTVAMLSLIARRGQPTLVIVDKRELLFQWQDRASQFLNIQRDDVGLVGAGKFSIGKFLTIGTIQTIVKHIEELKGCFGQVIVDECHKAAAPIFGETITQFTAKYIHGCTATPIRNDGQTEVIKFYLGEIRYQIQKQALLNNGDLCQARFKQIPTEFDSRLDGSTQYTQLMGELVEDDERNLLICQSVKDYTAEGLTLILTGRVNHCMVIRDMLKQNHGIDAHVLTGSLHAREREEVFNQIKEETAKYIIATTALLKEGFDLPVMQALFLAFPVKWKRAIIQMVGRVLRPAPNKSYALIVDFNDVKVGVLAHSARVRADVYMGEKIRQV